MARRVIARRIDTFHDDHGAMIIRPEMIIIFRRAMIALRRAIIIRRRTIIVPAPNDPRVTIIHAVSL